MFATRLLTPRYALRVGRAAAFASDGAPFYQLPVPGQLLTWPTLTCAPPPPWVMTERARMTKTGVKSAANP